MARSELGFDYVVVGGGTAGCVVAARLAEDFAATVCLIEAGGWPRHPAVPAPLLNFITSGLAAYQWGYWTEPNPQAGGRALPFPQARVVGGGSSINGMLYERGDRDDYDAWGAPGWRYDQVRSWFERAEADRVRLSDGAALTPLCSAFLDAAKAAAAPPDQFDYLAYSIGNGRRSSTAQAYLGRRPKNLTIMTGAQTSKIRLEGGRASGVEVIRKGAVLQVRADREVIVCAGGIGSPRLLMLSGIGPADALRALGLDVRVDLPDVGRNLQNHIRQKLAYETKGAVSAYSFLNPVSMAAAGLSYIGGRGGLLGRSVLTVGGLLRSAPDLTQPDIGLIFSPALMGTGVGALGMLPKAHGFSLFVRLARPWSRGEVRLRSADPLEAPIIDTRYFSDPRDMPALIAGVERMRAICTRPEIARFIARADQSEVTSEVLAATVSHAFHPVGTCAISAVVDESLRVRGVEGLRIADASVIPMLPKAGTNAPAIMIGERAAALVRGDEQIERACL